MTQDPVYQVWRSMIKRCSNPKTNGYERYGGRGISVCDRWKRFAMFFADMGQRPTAQHQIDRIDPDGNYEPGNCRWVTPEQQRNHQRPAIHTKGRHRTNRLVTAFSETLHMAEWSRRTGIDRTTITWRLDKGWSPERALTP
jgi:hypothetical protein